MSYPIYQGTGGISVATAGTALDVNVPSGVAINDILIANILITQNTIPTAPAGWTAIQSQVGFSTSYSYVSYWRRATSNETSTVRFTGTTFSGAFAGIIYRFSGCIQWGAPFELLWTAGVQPLSTTSVNTGWFPSISGSDRLGIALGITEDDTALSISGTEWTQASLLKSTIGTDVSFAVATKPLVSNTDGATLTMSTSDYASIVSFVLLPAIANPYPTPYLHSSQDSGVGTAFATVFYPSAMEVNDLLILNAAYMGGTTEDLSSDGWTTIDNSYEEGLLNHAVYWKRVDGTEPSYFSFSPIGTQTEVIATIYLFKNVKSSGTPYELFNKTGISADAYFASQSNPNSLGNNRLSIIALASDASLSYVNGFYYKAAVGNITGTQVKSYLLHQPIADIYTDDGSVGITLPSSGTYYSFVGFYLLPNENSSYTVINIGDDWKTMVGIKINIGDTWKTVESVKINIGDTWKDVM